MTYSEKLKDPRWQKVRLHVFERDEWRCKLCDDPSTSLHVHHKSYFGSNPWDTPTGELVTICSECHAIIEFLKNESIPEYPELICKYDPLDKEFTICVVFIHLNNVSGIRMLFIEYKNGLVKYLMSAHPRIIMDVAKNLEYISTQYINGK